MDKYAMREWISALEEIIDNKLKKWKKENKLENGETVHLRWTWEQHNIHLYIFWENQKESVRLLLISPREDHEYLWHGLNDQTFNRVQDRIGNVVQSIMHPPLDLP